MSFSPKDLPQNFYIASRFHQAIAVQSMRIWNHKHPLVRLYDYVDDFASAVEAYLADSNNLAIAPKGSIAYSYTPF